MNKHAKMWDGYVARHPHNPGNEWGSPEHWDQVFKQYFQGVETWKRAIEIGAGAGKYTKKVLDANDLVHVAALDVSQKFLDVLKAAMPQGRVSCHLLDYVKESKTGCSPMETICKAHEWEPGTVDAVYSIDAMVHVEWQLVVGYIASAAKVLRQGGKVIMSLANSTSKQGFAHLMNTIPDMYRADTSPDGQFHYTSPDAVLFAFHELGFGIDLMVDDTRDIWVVATKV